jgi:hypothetical protein
MKPKMLLLISLPAISLLVIVLIVAKAASSDAETPASAAAQPADEVLPQFSSEPVADDQGNVTVEVTPLNLNAAGDTLEFSVALNTHSVDLSMDLSKLATLTTDSGLVVSPVRWEAPSGGHHVSGTLVFPAQVDGKAVLAGATRLTLTLKDVAAPERTFAWAALPTGS